MASISGHEWVSAIVNAGRFAFLAGGFSVPEDLEKEIILTQRRTKQPFGVNLIVMHPCLDDLAEICIRCRVSHVMLVRGPPSSQLVKKLKEGHVKVMSFAPTLVLSKRLIKMGVDTLVIEGNELGGHIGPVNTIVLM